MMVARPDVYLGPHTAGEIPAPWVHDMDNYGGDPTVLAGFTAQLSYTVNGGGQVVRDATLVDAGEGRIGMVWIAADFATAGWMQGQLTVGDGGTRRYTASFACKVRAPLGGPIPTI